MPTILILIATISILTYLAFIKDRVEIVTGPAAAKKDELDAIIDDCIEEMGYRRG